MPLAPLAATLATPGLAAPYGPPEEPPLPLMPTPAAGQTAGPPPEPSSRMSPVHLEPTPPAPPATMQEVPVLEKPVPGLPALATTTVEPKVESFDAAGVAPLFAPAAPPAHPAPTW